MNSRNVKQKREVDTINSESKHIKCPYININKGIMEEN